jgi:putative ABC transport system substrate-binding protein
MAVDGFRQGLKELGYVEGQSVTIEYRWAEGQFDRLSTLATELLGRRIDLLVAGGGDTPALVAKSMKATVPIVFMTGGDPIVAGIVKSLSHPDGNVTGVTFFTTELGPKRVELLGELAPDIDKIAILDAPNGRGTDLVEAAVNSDKEKSLVLTAGTPHEIEIAFSTLVQERAQGLMIVSHPFFTNQRDLIVALASRHAIPTVHPLREYVLAGGLASYGASESDAYRQAGIYAARILKGTKPTDLPVLQPTKFELVINLRTARALGLTVPPSLLARADEVIE